MMLDRIGTPPHLLGSSLSAVCAMEAALRTDRVRSLILYEPPIRLPGTGPSLPDQDRRRRDTRDRMDVLAALHCGAQPADPSPVPEGWVECVAVARTYPR